MNRSVVTGSVITQFSEPTKNEYSPYATLPRELGNFLDQLASVEFPVNSKRELLEKLGGPEAPVYVGENVVTAAEGLMFLPATFFPVSDVANLAEKLSDHYASRAPATRRQDLPPEEIHDLARRFLAENPELVTAVARAVQSLNAITVAEGVDDDRVVEQFLKGNERLVDEVGSALRGIGRLKAKAREDIREHPGRG